MPLDPSIVGTTSAGSTLLMTRSRLRAFARATGQTDPVYIDIDAARQAGHRDLPVPPTFIFGIDLEAPDPFAFVEELNIDLRAVLHGEQEFRYEAMAYAGDELTTSSRVVDVYSKKGGLLDFLVREITVVNQDGVAVATMRNSLVVQNRAMEGAQA
ncbi:MaoC family dehydratase [Rhodococcus erythropolis]|uniref:MaoC family dehydratase N-terminal domain-containing protein n=1 Tax=Rhodococcus erythropolis TaxID=1833 RepID=UPI001F4337C9|nr:MaoC family dehydratase N-terminal domain-containing protein [Rhodococcus erythropolis]UJC81272.1 MaoC family dehydratase [Rhodococcus erythropolis]